MQPSIKQATNKQQLLPHLMLRYNIFWIEQDISILEEADTFDDKFDDQIVRHFGYYINNELIGTTRVIVCEKYYKIGRVTIAKQFRNQGHAKTMLDLVFKTLDLSNRYLYLSAQISAKKVYQDLGFIEYGNIYLDAGIEHIDMRCDNYEQL